VNLEGEHEDQGVGCLGGPFSLTSKISITHGAGVRQKKTSFDASLTVPDGGVTLSMLGAALLGMGLLRRKLRIRN
jgi:hypothetical protein